MCKWANIDPSEVTADAPSSLSFGIPDSNVIKELIAGFQSSGVIPLPVIHRYLVSSGLLEATVGYEDYVALLEENLKLKTSLGLTETDDTTDGDITSSKKPSVSPSTIKEVEGTEDK